VTEKKSNHQANVVRIENLRPHPDPETTKLELTDIGGYQVVVGKGNFAAGDLAVYIQPDSVVPQTEPFKFIWGEHVGIDGNVPERRRRITVKRLRKEYSEGLLMPVSEFAKEFGSDAAPDAFCVQGRCWG
jgi:RNA ligase (TIGR02306 family)